MKDKQLHSIYKIRKSENKIIEIEHKKFTIAPSPNIVVKPLPGLCILLKQSVTEKVVNEQENLKEMWIPVKLESGYENIDFKKLLQNNQDKCLFFFFFF